LPGLALGESIRRHSVPPAVRYTRIVPRLHRETRLGSIIVSFLLLLLLLPFAAWIVIMIRSRLNPLQCLLWGLAYLLCKFLWRAQWPGQLPLAADRGAIVVCNHRSSVDPFFVQVATGRKVHWMVAREYCEHPAFSWFLKACEVIPVNRGGIDTKATKAAIRITSAGGLVGMLPEGRINMTDQFMLPARPGAALVALKARALVIPCYIEGAPYRRYPWSPLLMGARVSVHFGQPLDLAEYYDRLDEPGVVKTAMRRILTALAELAGKPDFEPQIAGRNWKPTQAELDAAMDAADRREPG
jgi:1-acyl-sn-glycerol-3-phosphate acyltransferase